MVINYSNLRHELYLSLASITVNMNMDWLMLIKVEIVSDTKSNKQCRHRNIFFANVGIIFYTTKFYNYIFI